jgi:CheY-like chemotaxis protein
MTKVLVVEDEAILSEPFELVLRLASYDVSVARNGEEALKLCEQDAYDLILLDLMMPVLDGVGFLRRLAESGGAGNARIIILSNISSGPAVSDALALGAHRHVLKSALSPKDIVLLAQTELATA